jgi:hypothetical protein
MKSFDSAVKDGSPFLFGFLALLGMTPRLVTECENASHFRPVSPTNGHSDWKEESFLSFQFMLFKKVAF